MVDHVSRNETDDCVIGKSKEILSPISIKTDSFFYC